MTEINGDIIVLKRFEDCILFHKVFGIPSNKLDPF